MALVNPGKWVFEGDPGAVKIDVTYDASWGHPWVVWNPCMGDGSTFITMEGAIAEINRSLAEVNNVPKT